MRTIRELGALLAGSAARWWRTVPALAAWFTLGWLAESAGRYGSVALGSERPIRATLAFAAGEVVMVLCTIMMLHTLWGTLRAPHLARTSPEVPTAVAVPRRRLDVALAVIGPFIGVYALWGLVDKWVADLFFANIVVDPTGIYDRSVWSVDLDPVHLWFYVRVALVAYLSRLLFRALARRTGVRWLALPAVLAEGLFAFGMFMATLMGLDRFGTWWERRQLVWNYWHLRDRFLSALPDIHLPFGFTLPEALAGAVSWLVGTGLPAAWHWLLLPLVWLALAATVYGWGEYLAGDDVYRTSLGGRLARATHGPGPGSTLLRWLTTDLRDKYVPVVQSLLAVLRAGLPFLAAYLVVWSLLAALEHWVGAGLLLATGAGSREALIVGIPLRSLATGLVIVPAQMVLYATAFDRVVGARAGVQPFSRTLRSASTMNHSPRSRAYVAGTS